ncbi:hypothetical protein WJX72_001824 [[Myrmecia] bisecta]|uniref:Transmembrane protein 184A n=1 Tax=[Myrmecia] bisecta TaxID=41462 RepID=A0AAW1QE93_9CHLO
MTHLLGQPVYLAISGICAFTALFVAIFQIIGHLRNYTGPVFQRYIVRIIFMVPVYAVASWLSLMFDDKSIYFDTVRDCYEAWVIYNFLSLCLAFVGGPGAVEVKMSGYTLMPSCKYATCCLPPLPVNGRFVRHCKQGTLQFVLLKPILAIITLVLYSQNLYNEGNWSPAQGYLWLQIIYNLTYTTALYALLLFYMGAHDLLAPFNPLLKFVLVKSVIFLTFWQGLGVAMLVGANVIHSADDGKNLQNFIICVEMLPASIFMIWAFPYSEYKGTGATVGLGLDNMRHAISIHDVVSDTVHQFAPTYHNYVLYSNGGGNKSPPKTVRAKTFLAVGHETANKYRDNANLLANMEMGIHRNEGERTTSEQEAMDSPQPASMSSRDADLYGANGTIDEVDELYKTGPLEETDEGIATSSASIEDPLPHGGMAKVLQKIDTDDRESSAVDTALEIEDVVPQPKNSKGKALMGKSKDWSEIDLDMT